MSSLVAKEERQRRRALVLRPSSRAVNAFAPGMCGVKQATRRASSVLGSSSRRSFSLGRGSNVMEKSATHTPRQCIRVLDEEDNDVTPQPLYQVDPAVVPGKSRRFFVEELSVGSASDQITATGSVSRLFSRSLLGSSKISSQSTIDSMSEEAEESFSKRDMPVSFPDVQWKTDTVKELLTEEMLNEDIGVYISESDSISLLDIPSSVVSVEADDAEAMIQRNCQYAEVCRNRMGKYTDRSLQTLNEATKNKRVQINGLLMVDTAMAVSTWDMYDTLRSPVQSPEPEELNCPVAVVDTGRGAERNVLLGSTASIASAASSLKDVDLFGNTLHAGSDLQPIMHSDRFPHCLLVMERSVLGNIFQPSLAAYRQLPALEDPDSPAKPGPTEQSEASALQPLWTFSCLLSRDRGVSSMVWNKKNPDLLAVGYGESDTSVLKPGLVCCWSLKNPTWPECVIHCDSAVTSLDFSASNPSQLAVGMRDGSIAVYSVQSRDKNVLVVSSSECPKKHLGPVWQLRWTQQKLSLTAEDEGEALFSVSGDGRISSWFVHDSGFDCIDVMKLKTIHNVKRKDGRNPDRVLSALTPGLCFDFHPTDSSLYLAGTWDGHVHKCSCSNSQQFLETFRKHFCPVNCVAWCPLSPDVFLSCSSDWTIQLWKQDHLKPVLGFSSQRAVCDVKWSPKCATVFGAVNEGQLEIWDLNKSILDPVAVQPSASTFAMKALLFASHADCVLVGDSSGQVTVYQLKNLSIGEASQVDILEDLLFSAASE